MFFICLFGFLFCFVLFGFGGPGGGFGAPGGGFSDNRSSGKPLLLLRQKTPPGAPKPNKTNTEQTNKSLFSSDPEIVGIS